jgi:hypothetical protein
MSEDDPDLTAFYKTYGWWLEAQRPPLQWFLKRSPDVQMALAELGNSYIVNVSLGIGYAVADPEAAEAGVDADVNLDSEEVLLRKLAQGAALKSSLGRERPQDGLQSPAVTAPQSVGGAAKRQETRQERREKIARLFGRASGPAFEQETETKELLA